MRVTNAKVNFQISRQEVTGLDDFRIKHLFQSFTHKNDSLIRIIINVVKINPQ